MTRMWHLVRSDVRSQRIPLALFSIVLSAEVGLVAMGRFPGLNANYFPLMPLVRLVVSSLITALIVQRDSLVGTTAFWRTRPIGGRGLLVGKTAAVSAALVAMPALVLGAAWWSTGFRVADAAIVSATIALEQATVVLLTMMAAVVTPSLIQLVVAGVAGTTAVTVLNSILLPAIVTHWPFLGDAPNGPTPVWYLGLLFVCGVPAIAHQYLTLREWRTAALVGSALLVATGGARLFPAPADDYPRTPVNRSLIDPANVEIQVVPGSTTRYEQSRNIRGVTTPYAYYDGVLSARGNPSSTTLRLNRLESRLLLSGETLTTERRMWWRTLADTLGGRTWVVAYLTSLQAALGTSRLQVGEKVGTPLGRDAVALAWIPASTEARQRSSRAVLTARAEIDALRFIVSASVPVRTGAVLQTRGLGLVIDAVSPGSETPMTVRISDLDVLSPVIFGRNGAFVLRNARRHEALLLFYGRQLGGLRGTTGIARTGISRMAVSLKLPPVGSAYRGDETPPDAAWLADAELLLLTAESVGTFTREFQTEIIVGK